MQYRINKKNGDRLPALGFGGLRLPKTTDGNIDQTAVIRLVERAFELGITHFDTAYSYEGSEAALGNAIAKLGLRNSVTVSTKLPIAYCKSPSDFDYYFEESLNRLQMDYIDYYFLHALNRKERLEQLMDWGIADWIDKMKQQKRIKNIGFSSHASYKEFVRLIPAYDWDFTMIQFNYLDEDWQAGLKGLEFASRQGITVFIMEPVRGGMLAEHLPDSAKRIFDMLPHHYSYAARALRYVLNRPDVTMVLSGMNEIYQIEENCQVAENTWAQSLTEAELSSYASAAAEIRKVMDVPCTSCGYCMPCPRGVNIPACMNRLNASRLVGIERAKLDFAYHEASGRIQNCIGCGLCKHKCPQGIDIPQKISIARERFHI